MGKITNQLHLGQGGAAHQFTGVQLLLTCSFTSPQPPHSQVLLCPASSLHLSPSSLFCSLVSWHHPLPSSLLATTLVHERASPPSPKEAEHQQRERTHLGQEEGMEQSLTTAILPAPLSSQGYSGPGGSKLSMTLGVGFTQLKSYPTGPLASVIFLSCSCLLLFLPCSLLPSCHPMHLSPQTPTPQATRANCQGIRKRKLVPALRKLQV